MPTIPYPNVPKLPGVPQLNRNPSFPPGPPPALSSVIALGRLLQALLSKPAWGIYKNAPAGGAVTVTIGGQTVTAPPTAARASAPVVVPDSFREFNYENEWNVSDFPIQEGGFGSVNKVNNPFDIQLRMTKGGSLRDRTAFLKSIEAIAGDTNLYKIVTPEKVYPSVNVTRFKIRRSEQQGAYWFSEVDLFFREIRFVVAEYTSTSTNTVNALNPEDLPPVNTGDVQATPVPLDVTTDAAGV